MLHVTVQGCQIHCILQSCDEKSRTSSTLGGGTLRGPCKTNARYKRFAGSIFGTPDVGIEFTAQHATFSFQRLQQDQVNSVQASAQLVKR